MDTIRSCDHRRGKKPCKWASLVGIQLTPVHIQDNRVHWQEMSSRKRRAAMQREACVRLLSDTPDMSRLRDGDTQAKGDGAALDGAAEVNLDVIPTRHASRTRDEEILQRALTSRTRTYAMQLPVPPAEPLPLQCSSCWEAFNGMSKRTLHRFATRAKLLNAGNSSEPRSDNSSPPAARKETNKPRRQTFAQIVREMILQKAQLLGHPMPNSPGEHLIITLPEATYRAGYQDYVTKCKEHNKRFCKYSTFCKAFPRDLVRLMKGCELKKCDACAILNQWMVEFKKNPGELANVYMSIHTHKDWHIRQRHLQVAVCNWAMDHDDTLVISPDGWNKARTQFPILAISARAHCMIATPLGQTAHGVVGG